MSGEKSTAGAGLVTSDAVTAGARLRKRLMWVVIGVLALVVIGGGIWLATQNGWFNRTPAPQKQNLNNLSAAAAIKAAQDEVNAATTASDKAQAYMDLGQAYLRNSQTDQAITAYQQAVTNSSSTSNGSGSSGSGGSNRGSSGSSGSGSGGSQDTQLAALAQLGSAYGINGDTQHTIDTFEKIIAILKQSNDTTLKDQIPKYQNAINNLKTEGHQ